MGLKIQERGEVVKGEPVVQPGDELFWFNRPRLILYLINFVLFQNAFQLAFFAWTWYEFGLKSCFHSHLEDIIIRISMGVLIQILCSYVTLPLYALVTQMGSTMKPTIFNERVATALKNWHHTAKKHIKESKHSESKHSGIGASPMSSRSTTPSHHLSPVHLLRHHKSEVDSFHNSQRKSNVDIEQWETESPSPSHFHQGIGDVLSSQHQRHIELGFLDRNTNVQGPSSSSQVAPLPQHEINIRESNDGKSNDFSFDKSPSSK